ncbi:hypothetical protein V6N13_106030 [Hibiscus sabdariffa]|uniref:Uncharacterized protein n=1 Tax=Hibiscus sabdariffa TaxID=183260 RepID=A0ABR2EZI0_9ROSI
MKNAEASLVAQGGSLLRFDELCVVLILISRFIAHLPVTVKSYGKYFRGLQVGLVSPHFVFNVGNIVVINHSGRKGRPVFTSGLIFTMNSSERARKTR